jgi:thermitase
VALERENYAHPHRGRIRVRFWSDMATGIVYAADHGARVVEFELQQFLRSRYHHHAAQYLRAKKGVLVVAAGNDAEEITDTASADVTCVSATDSSDAFNLRIFPISEPY